MALKLITPPVVRVLSAAQLRSHLRIAHTQFDTSVLEPLIDDATAFLQSRNEIQLAPATWRLSLNCFPVGRNPIELRLPPVRQITSFKYWDSAGVEQTITDYQLDAESMPGVVIPGVNQYWPTTQAQRLVAAEIEFENGWPTENEIPEEARRAVKLLAGHWFMNPEAVVTGTIATEIGLAYKACEDTLRWK